jgi:hypothetical protein
MRSEYHIRRIQMVSCEADGIEVPLIFLNLLIIIYSIAFG